jgi:cell division protein FtsI/penicillin-binding protein 2
VKLNPLKKGTFDSASGLKPMSAYVVVGVVLLIAGARLFSLAGKDVLAADFRANRTDTEAPAPYRIEDREGRLLAASVPSYDLLLSPQVMWQNHTPARISKALAGALGQDTVWATALEAAMLPSRPDGWRMVTAWEFGPKEAARVEEWIVDKELAGWAVEADIELPATWRLWWQPRRVLSEAERERHFEKVGPARWTRHLTSGLWHARHAPSRAGLVKAAYDPVEAGEEIWSGLLPEVHNVPIERISPVAAMRVTAALESEQVARGHMRLVPRTDREHPAGEFSTLGDWGFTREGQEVSEAYVGLELAAAELATPEAMPWIDATLARYDWLADRISRRGLAPYFLASSQAALPVTVETSIDLALQRFTHAKLDEVLHVHDATLAMGIVLDVQSGEVLALDAVSTYPTRAFLPVAHLFTPGSTFKLVTMAMALDAGVVDPHSSELGVGRFDVGNGRAWPIPREFGIRTVDEAVGAPTGIQSLANCLAFSINAGMIQVGIKLSPAEFRGKLVELGYGKRPNAGLGGENFWPLTPLSRWKVRNEQVSISFGHNISVSLWQHAEALSAILRGGVWKPMTLVRAVRQGERREPIGSERGEPRRIFREGVGATVRDMMTLGAREGTGKKIVRDDIEMGTKTGTTWKELGVLSTRVEMQAIARHIDAGDELTNAAWHAERKALQRAHVGDPRQYTSSVVAVGHLPGADSSREVMVLVVIDEPQNGKFGSQVAGPTAVSLLSEALGLTVAGAPHEVVQADGFTTLEPGAPAVLATELPWKTVMEGTR